MSRNEEMRKMLSLDAHEEACELFCTWLLRLEERDRRNAAARLHEQQQPAQQQQQPPPTQQQPQQQQQQQQPAKTHETSKESKDAKEHYRTQQAHLSSDESDYRTLPRRYLTDLPTS